MRSTVQATAEWLRESILRGDLEPGERLIEHKLSKQLGIGQPTLREALKELELQGFLRKIPKRGTYVTKLSKVDFEKGLEVRMALETLAVEHATLRLREPFATQISAQAIAMSEAADRFDLAEYHRNDIAFHRTIWQAADNPFLTLALERIVFGLFAFILLQRKPEKQKLFVAAAKQHMEIVEGILSGDPRQARRVFVESTLRFWNDWHDVNIQPSDGCVIALESLPVGPCGE